MAFWLSLKYFRERRRQMISLGAARVITHFFIVICA